MTPPAKAGGFSEERLHAPTAAFQATAQVSPCGHLSRLAPEGPIRALKRGTPCSPQGLKATLPALCRGGRDHQGDLASGWHADRLPLDRLPRLLRDAARL